MSHYANYIKEREGKEIIEDEFGFVTYSTHQDYVYIEDIYVTPEHRRQKKCYEYADKVAAIAKENGYSKLLGSIDPEGTGAHESLLVLLNYGYKLHATHNNVIYFMKEI